MKMEMQSLHTKLIYWVIRKDVYFQMSQVFFSPFSTFLVFLLEF